MTLDILYQRWFTPKLRFQILVNLIVYPVSISLYTSQKYCFRPTLWYRIFVYKVIPKWGSICFALHINFIQLLCTWYTLDVYCTCNTNMYASCKQLFIMQAKKIIQMHLKCDTRIYEEYYLQLRINSW